MSLADDLVMASPIGKIDFKSVIDEAKRGAAEITPYELYEEFCSASSENEILYRAFVLAQPQVFQDEFWNYCMIPLSATTSVRMSRTSS